MDPSRSQATALNATPSKRPSVWWGVGITLVGWLILAFPAFATLFLTASAFSGCFLECTKPEPATGVAG
ncbi:hypothetical protein CVV68_06905 [Arthrobacter livingstonensis]|uniref:Uncharacterized protein n=1 Tax=Arthrobacter livingstonensis TaxID=670078 RepID=A0A2V5LFA2_9MICC|nr:hypothetical protein [Arthrobacter livingstonensis]PYI68523.1 hypothetical protein CVV68_06905 [Arthrobacter livingstonensis]